MSEEKPLEENSSNATGTQASDRAVAIRQAIKAGDRGLILQTMDDFVRFAIKVAQSQFCPPGFSEVDCFIALQKGAEVGLTPMQSLESIYVVNNRATLFGDAPKALVEASGLMLDYSQEEIGTFPNDDYGYRISSLRKGRSKAIVSIFTIADAKLAKLWPPKDGRSTAWTTAPKRMLMWRARGFNLRDNFPDVLKGLQIGELVDEEAQEGFEHAKSAMGRIVEPNFETKARFEEIKTAVKAAPPPAEVPKRGRGRPPKQPPEPTPVSKLTSVLNDPEPSELWPKDATAEAPQTAPESESDTLVGQIVKRLEAERIPIMEFLLLMERNAFLDADVQDIKLGHVDLKDVDPDGLDAALKWWPQVVAELKGAGK